MSALAGIFGPAAETSAPAIRDMLAAMQNRASGTPEEFNSSGAVLVAARHDWEAGLSGWVGPLIATDDDWTVAADASLYYLDDLCRQLRSAPRNAGTAELLLLALRRWGPGFARYIEGDYAIVARERRSGRILLARDFGGRRTLAYAQARGSLVAASSVTAVVRHPQVSPEYDLGFIAAAACGRVVPGARTAFRQVSMVPAGSTLSIEDGRVTEVNRWTPPPMDPNWETEPSAAAVEQLRHLVIEATRERLAAEGTTTVWMSGGWDSTSVFASACARMDARTRSSRPVLPVSMTFPADDIGNEDHHIRALAERWEVPVRWVDTDQIPLLVDADRRALVRDDPLSQPFESQMRTLSQASRELRSRVVLDGVGGDQLFFTSSAAIVADHFRYGRWHLLWNYWRNWQIPARQFARLVLLPNLSAPVRDWIGTVRGSPLFGITERGVPDWIVQTPEVVAGLVDEFEQEPGEGAAEFESRSGMSTSFVSRMVALNMAFGLEVGVQLRAPLFDQRLIAFAASRPLSDRGQAGDGKRVLRMAMKGLIPDSVLAARGRKTGTTGGYFAREFEPRVRDEVQRMFGRGASRLEKLGLVRPGTVLEAVDLYLEGGVKGLGPVLYTTLETERWLAVRDPRL